MSDTTPSQPHHPIASIILSNGREAVVAVRDIENGISIIALSIDERRLGNFEIQITGNFSFGDQADVPIVNMVAAIVDNDDFDDQ